MTNLVLNVSYLYYFYFLLQNIQYNLLMAINLKYFTIEDGDRFVDIIFGTTTTELIFSAKNLTEFIVLEK